MARAATKVQAALAVCIESYATAEALFKRGTELRADSPAVLAHPHRWAPAGTPTNELHVMRTKTIPDPPAEPTRPGPPTYPDTEAVLARETFLVVATGQTVNKGQRFHRDDPLVKQHPQHFATAPVPLTSAGR